MDDRNQAFSSEEEEDDRNNEEDDDEHEHEYDDDESSREGDVGDGNSDDDESEPYTATKNNTIYGANTTDSIIEKLKFSLNRIQKISAY